MKKFCFFICFIGTVFIIYKEVEYLREFSAICKEDKIKEKIIMDEIGMKYHPRKKDFYKDCGNKR